MMNRVIKFRAWDESVNQMFALNGIKQHPTIGDMFRIDYFEDADNVPVFKSQVMQYTGLKDKNGVEIFEADIYHHGDININYKVIFDGGQFIGNQVGNSSLSGLTYWLDRIEVIGNIYENPELIK